MYCTRFIVCIVNLVAFVLVLVGVLPVVPLFSASYLGEDDSHTTVTLWDSKTSPFTLSGGNFTVPESNKTRLNYLYCSDAKSAFRALQAFALAALVLSFFAFLISLLQCAWKLKVKMPLFLYTLLGFICELIAIIVVAVTYTSSFCKSPTTNGSMINFHKWGYKIGTGFIAHIIACALLLISTIMCPFTQDLWCGNK